MEDKDFSAKRLEADAAIAKMDLNHERNHAEYVRRMEHRFGRDGVRFLDAIDEAIATQSLGQPLVMRDIYAKKNRDWRMSLLISMNEDSVKYQQLLRWVGAQSMLSGGRIAEVGCDLGIFACGLALMFPESSITGFDAEPSAVRNAKLLARSKQILNVSFEQHRFGESQQLECEPFDLVFAPFVFHEIFRNALDGSGLSEIETAAAKHLYELVGSQGALVSIDRLPFGHEQAEPMVELLSDAGFNLVHQDILEATHSGASERFPISLFEK